MESIGPAALHPVALSLTLLLGALLLAVPRRWCMLPFAIGAIFVPFEQRIVVSGFDWSMLRLLILFAYARVAMRGEFSGVRWQPLDAIIASLTLVVVTAYTIREASTSAFVNRLGWALDGMGVYFYCRIALRSREDVLTTIRVVLPCSILLALCMAFESSTGRNLFSLIGGVPEYTEVREGRMRAQGAFSHSIMAGLFGASWMPLFASFWWMGMRARAIVGGVACTVVVLCSASATPVAGLACGALALALWPIRAYMRILRWSVFVVLVVLHLVRDMPVWHLLARVELVGGSTGWHRFHLIDQAIDHFGEWWLIGISYTWHWGLDMSDITNEYLWVGINGGVLGTVLLISEVAVAFGAMGRAAKSRFLVPRDRRFAWCVGAMLTVHATSFIASGYFGQMRSLWFLHLAILAAVSGWERGASRAKRESPARATAAAAPRIAAAR